MKHCSTIIVINEVAILENESAMVSLQVHKKVLTGETNAQVIY